MRHSTKRRGDGEERRMGDDVVYRIHFPNISSGEPSVLERLLGFLIILVISVHDIVSSNDDFTARIRIVFQRIPKRETTISRWSQPPIPQQDRGHLPHVGYWHEHDLAGGDGRSATTRGRVVGVHDGCPSACLCETVTLMPRKLWLLKKDARVFYPSPQSNSDRYI